MTDDPDFIPGDGVRKKFKLARRNSMMKTLRKAKHPEHKLRPGVVEEEPLRFQGKTALEMSPADEDTLRRFCALALNLKDDNDVLMAIIYLNQVEAVKAWAEVTEEAEKAYDALMEAKGRHGVVEKRRNDADRFAETGEPPDWSGICLKTAGPV